MTAQQQEPTMREEIAAAMRDEMPCLISERVGGELADVVLAVLERRGDDDAAHDARCERRHGNGYCFCTKRRTLSDDAARARRVRELADELESVAQGYRHAAAGTYDAGARNSHMAIARSIRRALDGDDTGSGQ